MSEATALLQRMRAEREREKQPAPAPINPEDLKVHLIVTPHRRYQLKLWLVLAFAAMLALVARDLNVDKPWLLTSLPIIGLGFIICLIPPTEEWEYKPWQTRARQYERHQLER